VQGEQVILFALFYLINMPSQRSILIAIHDNNLDPKQDYTLVKDKLVLKSELAKKKKAASEKQLVKSVTVPAQVKEVKVELTVEKAEPVTEPVVEQPKEVKVELPVEEPKPVVEEPVAKKLFGKQVKPQQAPSAKEDEK
jgi:hypothetical protein